MISRKSIKDRLVSLLKGRTYAGQNVKASRSIPTDIDDLPIILIYLKNESIEIFDESPRTYKREARFIIESVITGDNDCEADDLVEEMTGKIEDELGKDEALGFGQEVDDSWFEEIQFQSEADGQSPVAATIATFTVRYYTKPNIVDCAPDFDTVHIDWQVGHNEESSDEVIDAEDDLTIPEE